MGRASEVRSRGAHRLVFGDKRKRERQLRCQRGRIENAIPCSISPTWQSEATHEAAASRFRDMAERSTDASEQPGAVAQTGAVPRRHGHTGMVPVERALIRAGCEATFSCATPGKIDPGTRPERGEMGGKKKEKKVEKRTHRFESAGGCWPRCLCLSTLTRTRDETSSFSRDPLPEPYACDVGRQAAEYCK